MFTKFYNLIIVFTPIFLIYLHKRFIPVLNVDGYVYNFNYYLKNNNIFAMIRKNRRSTGC